MADIDQQMHFDAEPARVWAVLTDLDRLGDWVEEHRGFPDGAPGELAQGTSYRQTVSAAGQDVDLEWTVVAFEPERELAFDGDGPAGAKATLRYELEPGEEGGTSLRYATSFELPGGPLGALAGRAAAPGEDDARATLERLRQIVDA